MTPVVEPRPLPRSKRAFETALVLATAPAWGLLFGVSALAVLVGSGRPVFYRQTRMGLGGRPFTLPKLRTMRNGPPPPDALFEGWTYRDDPRITRVGRVLRRYRLDELPQLILVLHGTMALVGPRPEPWDVAVALGEQIPGYHERHRVRPGLTGACQVSDDYGRFGTVEQQAVKTAHDVAYVRSLSLRRDLAILAQTARVLLRGGGVR